MKNKVPFIVVGVVLLFFGGLAVGRFAIAPVIGKYLKTPASEQLASGPIMLATPDGDEATDQQAKANGPGGPAYGSHGDPALQIDIWNLILQAEKGQNCSDITSTDVDVTQPPDPTGAWTEEWTVKACGDVRVFKIKLAPKSNGGTSIEITG